MSIKHYDAIPIGKARLAFYKEHCPEQLALATAKYIEIAFVLIYQTRKVKECKDVRKNLVREVKAMLAEDPQIPLTKNAKLKASALRIGLPVYTLLMNIYHLLRL